MFTLAILIGKIGAFLLGLIGRGSDLPGRVALKLCPKLLGKFKRNGKIIAVTGSNGKTTTAGMIAQTLTACGKTVKTNPIGSNMIGGVATVLLKASNLRGQINCDFLVLETDERWSRLIFADFKPDYMLVTNLFRDQITRNNNVDFIFDILNGIITPEMTLILNAMDPISVRLGKDCRKVYFGCDESGITSKEPLSITRDCKVCPVCKHRLSYDFYLHNHIGKYHCDNCGFTAPVPEYLLTDPDLEKGTAKINGINVKLEAPTAYGFMNLNAAAAVCTEAGLPFDQVIAALNGIKTNKTRIDRFKIGERDGVMILSKNQNPVSFDLSISEVLRIPGDKTVVAYINNINHTNHRDTTWLWDIAFERLTGNVSNVICAGPRAYDLAVRLKYAGFDMDTVLVEPDNSGIKAAVAKTKGTLCILTELYDAKTIMEAAGR
ncbi:MAG TPA: MurT ligase domain-containing protein [Oscillospiraceae bacterium]|nr:MurT ligase domain-containing protein [Oscillospiraceae bacterium]HPF56820.1 MurT ligase domain-containing protein [Clostridiales bacterium]HPK35778.1 MurT ligase domain-containing protein [Oscillospiraceae bacterium]HPR75398.1 MurT ligase domain-containing protein [Oscillospiraceae bacterium]